MSAYIMGIILYFYKQPHFFQLFYNSSPRLIAIHPLEFPAICINRGLPRTRIL